jgi:hypothetical protein
MIQTIVSWFTALFKWIARIFEWFGGLFKDFMEFFLDLPLRILGWFLDGAIYLLSQIPVPGFLQGGSILQVVFNALHNDVQYLVSFFGIPAGLAIFGAGVVFRLTRKAATLGQW